VSIEAHVSIRRGTQTRRTPIEAPVGDELLFEQRITAPPVVRDGATPQGEAADRSHPFDKGDSRSEEPAAGCRALRSRDGCSGPRTVRDGDAVGCFSPPRSRAGRATEGGPQRTLWSRRRPGGGCATNGAVARRRSESKLRSGSEDRGEGSLTGYGTANPSTAARRR